MTQKEYFQLPSNEVAQHWGLISNLILKAINKNKYNDHTLEGIFNRLIYNEWQAFVILKEGELESLIISCVIPFDLCNYLNPIYICSNTDKVDLEYMQTALEEIAKKFNCSRIMGGGRIGWKRVLKKLGYEDLNLVVKEL